VLFRIGGTRWNQSNAAEPVTVGLQAMQQIPMLLELGTADLYQHRLLNPVGMHGSEQFLDWLFPIGRASRIDLPRKRVRCLGKDVNMGIDA
jgi:hypothetical protein